MTSIERKVEVALGVMFGVVAGAVLAARWFDRWTYKRGWAKHNAEQGRPAEPPARWSDNLGDEAEVAVDQSGDRIGPADLRERS